MKNTFKAAAAREGAAAEGGAPKLNEAVEVRKEPVAQGYKPSLIRSREDIEKEDYDRYCAMARKKIVEIYGTTRWSQKEAIRRQEEEAEKNRE